MSRNALIRNQIREAKAELAPAPKRPRAPRPAKAKKAKK